MGREMDTLGAWLKSFRVYAVEEDEDSIRLSVGGQQIACWGANSAQGIALLRFDAAHREMLASFGGARRAPDPDLVEARARLARLEHEAAAALEPFAAFAEKAERFVQGRADFGGSPIMPTKHFRVAHFAAARALLSRLREGGDA